MRNELWSCGVQQAGGPQRRLQWKGRAREGPALLLITLLLGMRPSVVVRLGCLWGCDDGYRGNEPQGAVSQKDELGPQL